MFKLRKNRSMAKFSEKQGEKCLTWLGKLQNLELLYMNIITFF